MKINKIIISLTFCLIFASTIFAQENKVIIGAGTVYNLPVGNLSTRFKGALGGMIYAGAAVSDDWTWVGKFEYFELNTLNSSKLYKKVEVQNINSAKQIFQFPLNKLSMKFKAAGLSAEAKLNLLRSDLLETNFNFGFGFYYWDNYRSAYKDTLFADTSGNGKLAQVALLDVPANRQTDWSGALNLGLDFSIHLFSPVWLNVGADYKLIIGELWPTLALDLENVSGLQFISFRAGLKVDF